MRLSLLFCVWISIGVASQSGCSKEGCLDGSDGCTVPTPCSNLDDAFVCADPRVSLGRIGTDATAVSGPHALGADGDYVLQNSLVRFVIDALHHPQQFSDAGGNILDATTAQGNDDHVNHVFQAVGALPGDIVVYTDVKTLHGDGFVALQFDGHLVGDVRQRVHTRYELRACEPGLRIRTEMVQGSDRNVVWSNGDGLWWGGRSLLPFVPAPGRGYFQPSFVPTTLNDVFVDAPFLVGTSHGEHPAAMVVVGCNLSGVSGFHSTSLSTSGTPRRIVPPGDYEVYERFIGLASGQGAQPGVDVALAARAQLFGEAFVTLRGRIVADGPVDFDNPVQASVELSEGRPSDDDDARTPLSHAVADTRGVFSLRVPTHKTTTLVLRSFGEDVWHKRIDVGDKDIDIGDIDMSAPARVVATVRVDGDLDHAQLIFVPFDDDNAANEGKEFEHTPPVCAPLLGPPAGASPACNRMLVYGAGEVAVPPGHYQVYATAGLNASIDIQELEVSPGELKVLEFALYRHSMSGLSADFHVHGAKSFDASIPDKDRVQAFLAAGMDVIASTDHDALWDYGAAMQAWSADRRLKLLVGTETTGHILWKYNPDVYYPQAIGHWIFFPLPFQDNLMLNGGPWDEYVEPAQLFERVMALGFARDTGVVQLNHPWGNAEAGRDNGFPRALGVRLDQPLPVTDDGSAQAMFLHTPPGASRSNAAYDVQEVMNGTKNELLLAYRAFWHYLLNQGIVRAGTANSDSHALTDSVLGTPRNIVRTDVTVATWDTARFNADVKAGHVLGTNGPVIEATLTDGSGSHLPSVTPLSVDDDAELAIAVYAPAWVPVEEVRILINGRTHRIAVDDAGGGDVTAPGLREVWRGRFVLRELLDEDARAKANKDTWLVVEAGARLPRTADLDCDGVPDTTDNNGDGDINWRDVDRNGDGRVTNSDVSGRSGDAVCAPAYGANPSNERPGIGPMLYPQPQRGDVGEAFAVLTPGANVFAFTNPFILDVDGNGFVGPGLP